MAEARKVEKKVESRLEKLEEEVLGSDLDTTDSPARYLGYLARLRPLAAAGRYVAYTSDIGESFRPVVSPRTVTAAYGISWAYLIGDVVFESVKARARAEETAPDYVSQIVGLTFAKRAIFQASASMLLPSITIHSIVKYAARWVKNSKIQNVRVRQWLPSALGLGAIPFLPFMFDEPVEHATDSAFDALERRLYPDERSPIRVALEAGKHHVQKAVQQEEGEKEGKSAAAAPGPPAGHAER